MDSKPKLLVIELWGLGDLCMATPFLHAATRNWDVTLLAKPHARSLQSLWPEVRIIELTAPWTAFRGKYQLWRWPWEELSAAMKNVRAASPNAAVSARWDPRDHLLMYFSGATRRIGFSRVGSGIFLTESLPRPEIKSHRYDAWRRIAQALGIDVPALPRSQVSAARPGPIVLHTGAAQALRVWPLERFLTVVQKLRSEGQSVKILCDRGQQVWWHEHGEKSSAAPESVSALVQELQGSSAFIGNDSGPGHLAAVLGIPTFTIFGPAFPEEMAPIHPNAEWIEGAPCPFKACRDNCRFPQPNCILEISAEDAWKKISPFVQRNSLRP